MKTYKTSKKWGSVWTQGKKVGSLWHNGVKFYDIRLQPPTHLYFSRIHMNGILLSGDVPFVLNLSPPQSGVPIISYGDINSGILCMDISGTLLLDTRELNIGVFDAETGAAIRPMNTFMTSNPYMGGISWMKSPPAFQIFSYIYPNNLYDSFWNYRVDDLIFPVEFRCYIERSGDVLARKRYDFMITRSS